ncbi:hypothetical protein BH10PSE17_BH10PSE17_03180 [soil metagenome]
MNCNRTLLAIAGASMMVAGCTTPAAAPSQGVVQTQRFERSAASALLVRGTGQVRGAALIRKSTGTSATCARADVDLIPATPYADERMGILYGPDTGETMVRYDGTDARGLPEPAPAEYLSTTLKTRCDTQGNFYFDQIRSGAFWIQTSVKWTDGSGPHGGLVALRVQVQDGQTVNVLMAPR